MKINILAHFQSVAIKLLAARHMMPLSDSDSV
jgi:hypothetical protein